MTQNELDAILREHERWLTGQGGERADLRNADLSGANLRGADLHDADLRYADLRRANLHDADLRRADLRYADLRNADLCNADLCRADLRRADLCGANLRDADLCGAENLNMPIACPESGSFVGWKAARDDLIVKLQIEEDALRSSATGRKCRCSKATVLEIQNSDGTPANVEFAMSRHDKTFTYRVGETLCVSDFDPDRWNECAPGIHFFITRQEAVDY